MAGLLRENVSYIFFFTEELVTLRGRWITDSLKSRRCILKSFILKCFFFYQAECDPANQLPKGRKRWGYGQNTGLLLQGWRCTSSVTPRTNRTSHSVSNWLHSG